MVEPESEVMETQDQQATQQAPKGGRMTAHTNSFRPLRSDANVDSLFDDVCQSLLVDADDVDTGHWQGKSGTPMSQTRELLNVRLALPIAATPGAWAAWVAPNVPWGEDHFKERVRGKPLNPPPSHVYWPFNQRGNEDHMTDEVFSHSYPERLWPTEAGAWASNGPIGIRYPAGDLSDLVQLLVREPHTRQAYVPLWFPEDLTAANELQRVPCTLGYHFILRNRRLNCFYPMRSLDWLRYFRDDAYMAG